MKLINLFYTDWKMGGIFSIMGANTSSECRCNGNVANREKT